MIEAAELAELSTDERDVWAILGEYAEQVAKDAGRDHSRWTWIFRAGVPHRRFVQSLVRLIDRARTSAGIRAAAAAAESADWTCICRCRAHGKASCPRCLNVSACPEHDEPTPAELARDVLEDPERLARELYEVVAESIRTESLGDDTSILPWPDAPLVTRLAIVEACRRVIVARAQAMIRSHGNS